jgi:hypothetical protein
MYDSLEGLDYKPGECSHYVTQVLRDIPLSKAKGDLVEKKREDIQVGDVYVGGFSSHLIRDFHSFPAIRADEEFCLMITREVLQRKRAEASRV